MDQDQTTVDNDLQKAIDDITNTTNGDPVFSDPVAAPSSVPEGDTGELQEPVGPFPEPKVEMAPPAPEPIAPIDPVNIPDLGVPELVPPTNAPAMPPMPEITTPAEAAPTVTETPETKAPASSGLSMRQIKESALRDLVPLIDRLDMNPTQKFSVYRDIFEELKDYTVLEPAYRSATEIPNDQERAEALLYLIEAIDKM